MEESILNTELTKDNPWKIIHLLSKELDKLYLKADEKKQDMHHFDGVQGRGVMCYLLKAYVGSDRPNWEYDFNECDNPDHQYEDGIYEFPQIALGVYSKGEMQEAKAHGKRHKDLTGEKWSIMETYLNI
jgi:hypothetical protein